MKHQCFTSLLGEKASRRLHATPLATCRHSSSLRDNISSTGRHTSTSTMDVRSSLVERERLWRHLVARERERETVTINPPIIISPPSSSLPSFLPGDQERERVVGVREGNSYHSIINLPTIFLTSPLPLSSPLN